MKKILVLTTLLLSVAATGQIKLNPSNGFYEHEAEIASKEALQNRLQDLNIEVADDLRCKGYFSTLVKGIAPVEIHYLGKERNGKFVLTSFAIKGGKTSAILNLEEVPKKAKRFYIDVINEKIAGMNL